ncbi:MAG: carboxypeptidase-like regulatory domain-containing protein [Terracidiphilus sp.]
MIIEFKNGFVPDARSAVAAPEVSRSASTPQMLRFILMFLLCIGVFAPVCVWGQFDSASVLGTIKDPSGASVPSATVDLLNIAKGIKVTRLTDANGDYEFTNVQPGEYTVTVAAAGFDKMQTDRFTVTVGARQRVELTLKVGTASQSVTVSGAAALLETDSSDRGETVQTEEAVDLPLNGRAYADLSVLVPGVRQSLLGTALSAPPRDASYNVNGLNSMANNFQLDGIDNNAYQTANQGFSNEAVIPSPDAVQEFKVETDNYSAEYGRAGGAIINATIRSGTNQIHGVAYDYLRNTVLNAFGPFIGTGVKPTLVQNQFGGTFGGPIKRDKLFYFADFEGLRNVNRAITTAVVPTAAQAQGIFMDTDGSPIPLQNPITGTQYPNGVIPVSDQSPFAAKVLSVLQADAAPNQNVAPGGNNYVSTPANTVTGNKGMAAWTITSARGRPHLGATARALWSFSWPQTFQDWLEATATERCTPILVRSPAVITSLPRRIPFCSFAWALRGRKAVKLRSTSARKACWRISTFPTSPQMPPSTAASTLR